MAEIQAKEEERRKSLELHLEKDRNDRIAYALEIWEQSDQAPNLPGHSAYLDLKQVGAYGIRYRIENDQSPVIVIPLRDIDGECQGIQYIYEDGSKRIHGAKKENFHLIGAENPIETVYIVEGYATGASVHEAMNMPVAVAFDCGNLMSVAQGLRRRYPHVKIIIAADNDSVTPGNPGKTKAEEAAALYGCEVVLPNFSNEIPSLKHLTDFNDLHVHYGVEILRAQLKPETTSSMVLNISELLKMEIRPKKMIVSPWLPEKGLAMIFAERGIGKTYLSLTLAYGVACGASVLRWDVSEPRKVLYIDGEIPGIALQERLRSISESYSVSALIHHIFRFTHRISK